MSSSSVRRRTDVVDDVMVDLIIAPTPDERPERLDSTIMTTTTTTTITTPPPPPPPLVDGTAVVPNEEPQHVEAAVVAATIRTPAPTESKPQQQQPPPAINNTNSSWDNTNNNNNNNTTTTKTTDDDDDGLFQRPTAIYQKSPELMMPSPFWWIAVGLGMIIGMIFTAWQMADYPDGLYAGLCRMILGSIQFLLSMVTLPLRKCCGGSSWGHYNYGGRSGHHEPYGRISTMEYGYISSSSSSSSNNKNHCCNNPVLELP